MDIAIATLERGAAGEVGGDWAVGGGGTPVHGDAGGPALHANGVYLALASPRSCLLDRPSQKGDGAR